MSGRVTGPDGEPVKDAMLHVWHANSQGWYSHFDPTREADALQQPRRIKLGAGRQVCVPFQDAERLSRAARRRHGHADEGDRVATAIARRTSISSSRRPAIAS